MTVAAIRPPTHTLDSAARDCIEAADGDRGKAVAMLARSIEEDQDLRRDIADAAVVRGLRDAVSSAIHEQRRRYWRSVHDDGQKLAGDQLRKTSRAGIYSWWLSCGVALGDANRQQIEAERQMYAEQTAATAQREQWFRSILDRMPDSPRAKVRNHLSEDDLRSLLEQVKAA